MFRAAWTANIVPTSEGLPDEEIEGGAATFGGAQHQEYRPNDRIEAREQVAAHAQVVPPGIAGPGPGVARHQRRARVERQVEQAVGGVDQSVAVHQARRRIALAREFLDLVAREAEWSAQGK